LGPWFAVTANSAQAHPSVACAGGKYVVVWNDYSSGTNWAVYGQLISGSGALAGGNFVISPPVNGQDEEGATVASDGTNFLVTWMFSSAAWNYTTYGVFISPSGTMGVPFPIGQTVSLERDPLCAAFNGSNYLVAWNFENPDLNIYDIYARLVTPSGTFPGNEFAIETNQSKTFPALAFDGSDFLLSWGVSSRANVLFQFLNASGHPFGCQFTPFPAQGTQLPLLALPLFDGRRFVAVGTLSSGGLTPPAYGAGVYGVFIPSSTTPPQFCAAGACANGQFTLALEGTPGISYAIQMATNLTAPHWISLATNSLTNGTLSFTDPGATNRTRFYRAVKP